MFSSRLKNLRKTNDVTRVQVAEHLQIGVRAYQKYETGTGYPSYQGLTALADYFDVSIDYLVGRTDNPNSHKS